MEPFSAGLGGLQFLLSLQSMMNSTSLAQQNLQWQKQQAAEQKRLGTATRVDSHGNKQYYDEATNTWKTQLSPMQQAIQDATSTEQYRTLTEDAQRNRQARKRQAAASESAVTPYNQAIQEYLNNPTASEGSIRSEISTLGSLANQDKAKENQSTTIRQALRMGRGGSIPSIIKAVNDASGREVSNNLLSARQQALQEFQSRDTARNSKYLPAISQWQSIINNGGGSAPIRFSNDSAQLDNVQNQQASQLLSAIQSGNSGINSAYGKLVSASSKTPDLSALINAIAKGSAAQAKADAEAAKHGGPGWDKYIRYEAVPDYLSDIDYGRTSSSIF